MAFTLPRVAQVGVTTEAAAQRDDLQVIEIPYGQVMRFQTLNDDCQLKLCSTARLN